MAKPLRTQRLLSLGAGLVPGVILGLHIAGLVFFLNPELPFEPIPVLRGMTYYAGLLGVTGLIVQVVVWLFWRQRKGIVPEEAHGAARRALPWTMTAALVSAAAIDGLHASIFAFYVPPGINIRLIKTAMWLGLAALVSFYTALLHSLHRRRYGLRSRVGLTLLALASIVVLVERREAFRTPVRTTPLPSSVEVEGRPSLILVGVDGLTLDAILPLAEQGDLPFFARMVQEGAFGRLRSLSPPRRDALWASVTTGKYPYRHRVLGGRAYRARFLSDPTPLRLLPRLPGFERWGVGDPWSKSEEPALLPVWKVLPRLGVPTGVVDWPGSTLGGDTLFTVPEAFFQDPDRGTTVPADIAERARLFRPAPERQALDGPRHDRWRESLARVLLDQFRSAEALLVYLPGLEETSQRFYGGYWEHQFEGARHRDYVRATETVVSHYQQLDGFLAELWQNRSGPTLLVVVSTHGTEVARGWRRAMRYLAGGRPVQGSSSDAPDGAVLLFGRGIAAGARLDEARLVDVAPTVLYGLGLPVARDLDGRIVMAAFEEGFLARQPLTFLPSYETLQAR